MQIIIKRPKMILEESTIELDTPMIREIPGSAKEEAKEDKCSFCTKRIFGAKIMVFDWTEAMLYYFHPDCFKQAAPDEPE